MTKERAQALLDAYVIGHEAEMPDETFVGDWLPGEGQNQPEVYTVKQLREIAAA